MTHWRVLRVGALSGALAVFARAGVGAALSRSYWGYAFARPGVPSAVTGATEVSGVAALVPTREQGKCSLHAAPVSVVDLTERIRIARPYVEELPGTRGLVALADRGLRPKAAPYDSTISGSPTGRVMDRQPPVGECLGVRRTSWGSTPDGGEG